MLRTSALSLSILILLACTIPGYGAIAYTWTNFTGTSELWSTVGDWDSAGAPGAGYSGMMVNMSGNFTAAQTITLDGSSAITVGQLQAGDTAGTGTAWSKVTLAGSNVLLFDSGLSNALLKNVGGHANAILAVSAPVQIGGNGVLEIQSAGAGPTQISGSLTGTLATIMNILNDGGGAGSVTISGVISDGSGGGKVSVTQNSATSSLVLSNTNTFSGGVTLSAGTLSLQMGGALGTGKLTILGGTLDNTNSGQTQVNNNAVDWKGNFAFTGNSNALNLGTGAVTVYQNMVITCNSTGAITFGGAISEDTPGANYTLEKKGTGILVLTGANNMGGAVTITAGELGFGPGGTGLPASAAITVNAAGGAGFQWAGSGNTYDISAKPNVTLPTSGQLLLDVATGNNPTLNNAILGSTAAGVTKNGAGVLTIDSSVVNQFTGNFQLSAGLVNFANKDNLGNGNTVAFFGGGLQWSAGNTADITDPAFGHPLHFNSSPQFDPNGNVVTFSTTNGLTGSANIGLKLVGTAGTLVLAADNNYGGMTNIAGSNTLQVKAPNAMGTGAISFTSPGARLDMDLAPGVSIYPYNLNPLSVSGNIYILTSQDQTLGSVNGAYQVTVNVLKDGDPAAAATPRLTFGNWAFKDQQNFIVPSTANVTISSISLSGATGRTMNLQGSAPDCIVTGTISNGAGGMTVAVAGSGQWTFNSANSYTGGTTIGGTATLIVKDPQGLGTGAITMNGGTLKTLFDGAIPSYDFTATGATTTSTIVIGRGSSGPAVSQTLNALTLGNNNNVVLVAKTGGSGENVSDGTSTLTFAGPVSLLATGTNNYTLKGDTANIIVTNAIAGRSTAGRTTTLFLDGSTTGSRLNGLVSNGTGGGTLAVTKNGSGTWRLAGGTYTGNTTVNAGTLVLAGDIAANAVVNNNGILAGAGSIGGLLTVNSGGTYMPGSSPATVAVGAITMLSGANLVIDIDGTSAGQFDQLVSSGTISLGGANLTINLAYAPQIGDSFEIINNTGSPAVSGTLNPSPITATFNSVVYEFTADYLGGTGNDVVITVAAATPEPATIGLLMLGSLTLLGRRRFQPGKR